MSYSLTSLFLAALLLGACTRGEDADGQAEPPAAAATVADSSEWRLGARGFGPLVVGMNASDAARATGGALSVPAVDSPEQCDYATWDGAPTGIQVMFEGGILARIDASAPGVATTDGLAVGHAAARADSLYGPTMVRRPLKYEESAYLIVRPFAPADTLHRLVFEVVGGVVTRMRGGRFPQVEYVEGCA